MKNKLMELLIFVMFLSLVLYPNVISNEMLEATKVFTTVLFPSIFPFFLVSDLLISYNFHLTLNHYFERITKKVFHVCNASSFIIIMSILSGFPSGSKYIKTFLEKNMISIDEANYLITFTHFANPLFVLVITKNIFYNKLIPYIILICMYLSNFILGFIIRPKAVGYSKKIMNDGRVSSFSENLSSSIYSSFKLLLIILGSTCFFYIVSGLICQYYDKNSSIYLFINGFFDMTKGITALISFNSTAFLKGIIILTFLSFGGCNVNMQVASILSLTGVKYKNFLLGRICQSALSIILFLIASKCIVII